MCTCICDAYIGNAHDCKQNYIIFANVLVSYNCSDFHKPCIAMNYGPPILAIKLGENLQHLPEILTCSGGRGRRGRMQPPSRDGARPRERRPSSMEAHLSSVEESPIRRRRRGTSRDLVMSEVQNNRGMRVQG